MLLCVAQAVAFSAGLLAHAQRALAVATTDNTHDVEKQLQRKSLQVSHRIIHVLVACLPASYSTLKWAVCSYLLIIFLPILQQSGEHRVSLAVAHLPLFPACW